MQQFTTPAAVVECAASPVTVARTVPPVSAVKNQLATAAAARVRLRGVPFQNANTMLLSNRL